MGVKLSCKSSYAKYAIDKAQKPREANNEALYSVRPPTVPNISKTPG